jgi:hypothetical protein
MKLTIETFGPDNRTKQIGKSQYRIATDDITKQPTVWHITEGYNNLETGEWARARGYFTTDLQKVIDVFNRFTKEKEIVDGKRGGTEWNGRE